MRALRAANLVVTTSWPMRSERSARMTAMISAVLGSSVVLFCTPQPSHLDGFYDDVARALEARIAERLDAFEEMGLMVQIISCRQLALPSRYSRSILAWSSSPEKRWESRTSWS